MQLLTTTQSYIRNSNVLELRMFLYRGSRGVRFTDDNICISIAQYYTPIRDKIAISCM